MLVKIHSLFVTKEGEYYNLKAITESDEGYVTFNSRIDTPFLQISTTQDDYIKYENPTFKPIILNKSASFHFNANAWVNPKNNSLFTIEMGKQEKTHTPKKHRKYNKRKTTSKK